MRQLKETIDVQNRTKINSGLDLWICLLFDVIHTIIGDQWLINVGKANININKKRYLTDSTVNSPQRICVF